MAAKSRAVQKNEIEEKKSTPKLIVKGDVTKGQATKGDAAKTRTKKEKSSIDLDRLIHERTRLAIVSVLAANSLLTFTDLKSLLQVSDGNLSAHARKLEDAGYLTCNKSFDGRVPRTEFSLTAFGRAALNRYIKHMESLIKAMKKS
jgi:DNA-binding transcriptional ArsR family regulator